MKHVSALVLVVLYCVGCSAKTPNTKSHGGSALTEEQATAKVREWGGEVTVERNGPGTPAMGIYLGRSGITDADLLRLKGLENIRCLDLSGTKIGDAGLVIVKELPRLEILDLQKTKVTDVTLANMKNLKALKTLHLKDTKVTFAAARMLHAALPECTITGVREPGIAEIERLGGKVSFDGGSGGGKFWVAKDVDFSGTRLNDSGLVHIKELTNLENVSLANTDVTDAGLVHLKKLTRLRRLNVSATYMTEAGLKHFEGLTELQWLGLSGIVVTDAGLVHLKHLTKLMAMDQTMLEVTDSGLLHLKQLTNLLRLNLAGPGVTDAGLANLKRLTRLKTLNLCKTKVSRAGIEELEHALPQCEVLQGERAAEIGIRNARGAVYGVPATQVTLSRTRISDGGLRYLKYLPFLVSLDLSQTNVTDAGLVNLNGLTKLETLDLSGTKVSDAGVLHIKGLSKLKVLGVLGTKVSGEGAKQLKAVLPKCVVAGTTDQAQAIVELKNVGAQFLFEKRTPGRPVWTVSFGHERSKVTNTALVHVGRLTEVRSLYLAGTKVTDAALVHLKGLTKLQSLDLSGSKVTATGLVHLQALPKLKSVLLYGKDFGPKLAHANAKELHAIAEIIKVGGSVQWDVKSRECPVTYVHFPIRFDKRDLVKVNDAVLLNLKQFPELRILSLNQTRVTDAGLKQLKGLSKLQTLVLSETGITDAGLVHLKGLTELLFLNLNGTNVTDAGLMHLKRLTNLKRLGLCKKVTSAGVKELQITLPNCKIQR